MRGDFCGIDVDDQGVIDRGPCCRVAGAEFIPCPGANGFHRRRQRGADLIAEVSEFLVAAVDRGIRRHLRDQAGGHQRVEQVDVTDVVAAEDQRQCQRGHRGADGVRQVRVLLASQCVVDGVGDGEVGGGAGEG